MAELKGRIATIGVFDGVHLGHRWLLSQLKKEAQAHGLIPTVITFDRHPLSIIAPQKAPRLLMPTDERINELRKEEVDVFCLDFDNKLRRLDARAFLKMLYDDYGINVLMMGFNHHFGSDRINDFSRYAAIGQEVGIEILKSQEYPGLENVSSSSIRQALITGNISDATKMSGHPYRLAGKVMPGRAVGRKLGFPTANLMPDEPQQLIPHTGVYAVDILLPDGNKKRGVLNIGFRPTIDHSETPSLSIEAHVIGWSGNLYDKKIDVIFLDYLRGEMKFNSPDELAVQLKSDCESALRIE